MPVAHQKLKHSKILKIAISTFRGKSGFKLDLSYFRASKLDFVCFDNPHRRQMTYLTLLNIFEEQVVIDFSLLALDMRIHFT